LQGRVREAAEVRTTKRWWELLVEVEGWLEGRREDRAPGTSRVKGVGQRRWPREDMARASIGRVLGAWRERVGQDRRAPRPPMLTGAELESVVRASASRGECPERNTFSVCRVSGGERMFSRIGRWFSEGGLERLRARGPGATRVWILVVRMESGALVPNQPHGGQRSGSGRPVKKPRPNWYK
jgi:hypothetical protein